MTVNYNYLGYGVTDSNGKAKLEYDSEGDPLTHSYTGTGAGKIDVVASLDSPSSISDSSLVSETHALYDCAFYDEAVTGHKNNYWRNNNGWDIQVTSDGTTITEITNGQELLVSTVENGVLFSTRRLFDLDFSIEVDIDNIVNTPKFILYLNNTNTNRIINTEGHYKIDVKSTGVTITVNGTTSVWYNQPVTTQVALGFVDTDTSTTSSLRFKNFKVYPI